MALASGSDPDNLLGFLAQNVSYAPNLVTKGQPQSQAQPALPKFTLSVPEESGLHNMSPLLKQRDQQPAIESSLANSTCSELGVDGLLEKLNGTLGTSYTLEDLSESLQSTLKSCIERSYDFGTAYARLRPYWFEDTSRDIIEDERNDQDMRNQLLVDNKIIDGDAPPRRVWDLHANRVVPYWVVGKYPWAISHAWVNDDELKHVRTPINQKEWPVPIPKDANLDRIRIEMLNLGAEYVWLDVLCMRQKLGKRLGKKEGEEREELRKRREQEDEEALRGEVGKKENEERRKQADEGLRKERHRPEVGISEETFHTEPLLPKETHRWGLGHGFNMGPYRREPALRKETHRPRPELDLHKLDRRQELRGNLWRLEEWKVDVPTIGWVYRKAGQVVCYFGGLGRSLTTVDFESDRCWFNRAWTLQEMNIDPIIGGRTGPEEKVPDKLHTRLESLRRMRRDDFVFDILIQMQTRKSTNLVDKVASLVYLFHSEDIPIYDEDQSEEDAWTALLNVTQDWFRADLFFFYPEPGDGKKVWRPSWDQAMKHTVSRRDPSQVMGKIGQRGGKDVDCYRGPCIESAEVRGLDNKLKASDASAQKKSRRGELHLKDSNGKTHTFKIIVDHTYPIPDGPYTLIGSTGFPSTRSALLWVVGKIEDEKFKKFSVFSMADDRVGARLQGLEIAEHREVDLW